MTIAPPRTTVWTLHAADGLTPIAAIDTYETAKVTARFNAVSSWEVVLPTATEACQLLLAASRPRVIFTDQDGVAFRSGPPIDFAREIADDGDMTTITGVDDLVWLSRRVAHPQPGSTGPPYSSQAHDVRTALAAAVIWQYVNVNAGPGAIPARRVPDLVTDPPSGFDLGPTITRRLRYQNLLEAMVRIAETYGFGLEVIDMEFRIFRPTGSARFSVELGTLAGSQSALTAPDANYVYAAGSGEGVARLIVEAQDAASVADWGRFETFLDQRSTSDPAELASEAAEELADAVTLPTVEMDAIDTEGQRFGVDWGLGSVATVWLDRDTALTQVIREVVIDLIPNAPAVIRPTLGGSLDLALWRELTRTDARVRALEVR